MVIVGKKVGSGIVRIVGVRSGRCVGNKYLRVIEGGLGAIGGTIIIVFVFLLRLCGICCDAVDTKLL